MKKYRDILKKMDEVKFHPLCTFFPIPSESELNSMAERMKESGQYYPILRLKSSGETIDGRVRYILCLMAEIIPKFIDLDITDNREIADVVNRLNFDRRHIGLGTKLGIGIRMEKWLNRTLGIIPQEDDNLRGIQDLAMSKQTAKKIHTTSKALNQYKQLIKEAETNPEVKKALENLQKGKKEDSLDRLYKKYMKAPKRKTTFKAQKTPTKIELRQKIIDIKEELKIVRIDKSIYERLYKEVKKVAKEIDVWEQILPRLTILLDNVRKVQDKKTFPTVSELREAELL